MYYGSHALHWRQYIRKVAHIYGNSEFAAEVRRWSPLRRNYRHAAPHQVAHKRASDEA